MLNFANSIQAACGATVSATQFLKAEACSALVFQGEAVDSLQGGNPAAMEVGWESAAREAAAGSLTPDVFEGLVKGFLRGCWMQHQDPDNLLRELVKDNGPGVAMLIGKAADAIERRCGCVWGINDTACGGFVSLKEVIA